MRKFTWSILGKWLEMRTRYIHWADGRLAQMVIATDITASTSSRGIIAAFTQAERAQNASRLITMGEMASSVAHELNQPLTAITNYCNGMLSRIKGQQIQRGRLDLGAWKRRHIKHSVRGKSFSAFGSVSSKEVSPTEPHRMWSTMVDEAVELAEIELQPSKCASVNH
jgi:signal transduction histidine kinase